MISNWRNRLPFSYLKWTAKHQHYKAAVSFAVLVKSITLSYSHTAADLCTLQILTRAPNELHYLYLLIWTSVIKIKRSTEQESQKERTSDDITEDRTVKVTPCRLDESTTSRFHISASQFSKHSKNMSCLDVSLHVSTAADTCLCWCLSCVGPESGCCRHFLLGSILPFQLSLSYLSVCVCVCEFTLGLCEFVALR